MVDEKLTTEEKAAGVDEVRDETHWITGEYLSAACNMVARQYLDGDHHYAPNDRAAFAEDAAYKLKQHAPLAYAFFFQNYHGEATIPPGTVDIILDYIRKENPTFLGGLAHGGIIVPPGFRRQ